ILKDSTRSVVVVSAPGKSQEEGNKITDLLYLLHAHLKYGVDYQALFQLIRQRFETMAKELNLSFDISSDFDRLKSQLSKTMDLEYLVSRGEYYNAVLMAEYLGYAFVDAKDVMKFDFHGSLDTEETNRLFEKALELHGKMVIPGFYGSYPNGQIHLLSRGGSDLTGSIAARALSASVYENWTDVTGILMADPRIVKNPHKIHEITYHELRELSYMGANVLHEDAILPLQDLDIPIHILNTNAPDETGTIIRAHCGDETQVITGLAGKKDFTVFTITKSNQSRKISVIQDVLRVFEQYGVNVEHLPSSIDSFSVIVEATQVERVFFDLIGKIHALDGVVGVDVEKEMALISVVGRNMPSRPGIAGKLFSEFGRQGININMIAQSSQEINIVVGVKNSDFEKTIRAIYEAFVV
ncbi:MAG: aspartate kinase, partial [Candidatus Izemoplasmatales bacterium]|nr:aspartate kinase [Candidatus Izemoplasmatales bacterium]